jgi:hypothetical protein
MSGEILNMENFLDIRNYERCIDKLFDDFYDITTKNGDSSLASRGYHYPAFIKNGSILFIGINPSYASTKEWPLANQPEKFFHPVNEEEERVLGLGKKDFKGYTYSFFNPMREISEKATGSETNWSHHDLFFFRESSQTYIDTLRKFHPEFLVRNLDVSLEILKKSKPSIIVVANGGASNILTGKYKIPGFTPPTWQTVYDGGRFKQVKAVGMESLADIPVIMTIMLSPFRGPGLKAEERRCLVERITMLYNGGSEQTSAGGVPQKAATQPPAGVSTTKIVNVESNGQAKKWLEFWDHVNGVLKTNYQLPDFPEVSPKSARQYIAVSLCGPVFLGAHWRTWPRRGLEVEVYVNVAKNSFRPEEFFSKLREYQDEIEKELALPLVWNNMDGYKACRVDCWHPNATDPRNSRERWDEYAEWIAERWAKMYDVFRPIVEKLFNES